MDTHRHSIHSPLPRRVLAGALGLALAAGLSALTPPGAFAAPGDWPSDYFAVDDAAKTITLLQDYETSAAIVVPDDYTLDGAGHAIRAVAATWSGPIVRNDGEGAITVDDLTIERTVTTGTWTSTGTAAGIYVLNGSLTATDVTIAGILGAGLGNGGYGVLVDNSALGGPATVTVRDAHITQYNKGGLYVFGATTQVVAEDNTIGEGNPSTPPNSILVGSGATSLISGNTITGAQSTQPGIYRTGTGILLYGAGDATILDNSITGTDAAVSADYNSANVNPTGRYTGITPDSDVIVAGNTITGPSSPQEDNVRAGIQVQAGKTGTVKHFGNTITGYTDDELLTDESADHILQPLYVAPTVTATRGTPADELPTTIEATISGNTAVDAVPFNYTVDLLKGTDVVTTDTGLSSDTTARSLPVTDAGNYTVRVTLVSGYGTVAGTSAAVEIAAPPSPTPIPTPTPTPTPSPTAPALSDTPPPLASPPTAPGTPDAPRPTSVPPSIPASSEVLAQAPAEADLGDAQVSSGGTTASIDLGSAWAYQWVYVVFYSEPTIVGWVQADADGVLSVAIPASLADGSHSLAAFDATGGIVALAAVELLPAADGDDESGDPGVDELPNTGSEILRLLPYALLLTAAGTVLTVLARRRHAARVSR